MIPSTRGPGLWCLCLLSVISCEPARPGTTKAISPASVEAIPPGTTRAPESRLASITLTAAAEQRLGIEAEPVARRSLPRQRLHGGVVTVPPGRRLVTAAPVAGAISVPDEQAPPLVAGTRIERGQPVFTLSPVVSPEARFAIRNAAIEAKGRLEGARSEVATARLAHSRAKQLLESRAGSEQAVEETGLRVDLAERAQAAAEALDGLATQVLETDDGAGLSPIVLRAPAAGVLWSIGTSAGQLVAAGTPLFEVVNLETLWIRVPVHVGEAESIDRKRPALVSPLAASMERARPLEATPVDAPPTANPLATTLDLFYEINTSELRPDQRVEVLLSLRESEAQLVVPWSAIVFDVHGGAWVYESQGAHRFTRRLVELSHVIGSLAAIRRGLEEGTLVVTAGAAELFGTEFGAGK